ncbi:hypothetical protein BD779DRAFT_1672467 [Infundibulicybe gibba]|nr:hypothetical protein BD779DRAFT_1672467 [Infundibulicybe gibba]
MFFRSALYLPVLLVLSGLLTQSAPSLKLPYGNELAIKRPSAPVKKPPPPAAPPVKAPPPQKPPPAVVTTKPASVAVAKPTTTSVVVAKPTTSSIVVAKPATSSVVVTKPATSSVVVAKSTTTAAVSTAATTKAVIKSSTVSLASTSTLSLATSSASASASVTASSGVLSSITSFTSASILSSAAPSASASASHSLLGCPPASASASVTVSSGVLSSITSLASASILSSAAPSASASASANTTDTDDNDFACPLYTAADAVDISSRELAQLASRAGEEFWFRYEDPAVTNPATGILQLAQRSGAKNFDDQAYKWISTDAAAVTRGAIKGRVPAIYVLPAGTRDEVLGAAKKFEETSAAKEAVSFVTKDNEPNDVGINGVQPENGVLPLDTFRAKVIRTVVKTVSGKGGGKATFTTITNGKASKTASKSDQAVLNKIC